MDVPQIKGYRELSAQDIEEINALKTVGETLGRMIDELEMREDIDYRWLFIGRTDIQKGLMAVIRSIAQPESF